MDTKPFEQGVEAATDGLPASANPYAEGTRANTDWENGYHSLIDHREDTETADDPTEHRNSAP